MVNIDRCLRLNEIVHITGLVSQEHTATTAAPRDFEATKNYGFFFAIGKLNGKYCTSAIALPRLGIGGPYKMLKEGVFMCHNTTYKYIIWHTLKDMY